MVSFVIKTIFDGSFFKSTPPPSIAINHKSGPLDTLITNITEPSDVHDKALIFIWNVQSIKAMTQSLPAALVLTEMLYPSLIEHQKSTPHLPWDKLCLLTSPHCELFMAEIFKEIIKNQKIKYADPLWIHPTAIIHPTATLAKGVQVGAYALIGAQRVIGEDVAIEHHVVIEHNVSIQKGSHIMAHGFIGHHSELGAHVILKPHVVIGSEGFGFIEVNHRQIPIPHLGHVIIKDDVQLGANTCVDRGKIAPTIIGRGSKFDNLCHVAHNVIIGEDGIFTAGFCAGGTSRIGDRVKAGGNTGIYPHVEVPSDTAFGLRAGVTRSITEPGIYGGIPVVPVQTYLKTHSLQPKLPKLFKDVKQMEERLKNIEKAKQSD